MPAGGLASFQGTWPTAGKDSQMNPLFGAVVFQFWQRDSFEAIRRVSIFEASSAQA